MEETPKKAGGAPGQVPRHALLLSLVSLWIPILASSVFPEWTYESVGILVWLLALIPAFLLSFYKGWRGASLALAAGMAAFSVAQVIIVVTDAELPPTEVLLGAAIVLVAVALGSGWITSLLRSSLHSAEEMALTDANTRLPNRRHGLIHLESTFEGVRRGGAMAVVLFDLDRFKQVNDNYGHAVGDEVLIEFASILRNRTRSMDLSARFGGEEFLTVLQDCKAEGAVHFAEDVQRRLREKEWPWGTQTVSAGVAEYEPGMTSPEVLVAAADEALYVAKDKGRDRVCVAGEETEGREQERGSEEHEGVAAATEEVRGQGELILVVESQEATRNTLGKALRKVGYEVLVAHDLESAVEIFRGLEDGLDLLLTEVMVPPTSGFRLVSQISAEQPDLRVVYMSEQGEEGWDDAPGLVRSYLQKPFSISDLTDRVREMLDTPTQVADEARPTEGGPEVEPGAKREAQAEEVEESTSEDQAVAILAPSQEEAQAFAFRLQHLGYHNSWTGEDVEDLVEASGMHPDLVLVRTSGPGADQVARMRSIREAVDPERTGFPPILALMDRHWPDLQWQALHLGAFDYLEEPHALEEMGVRVGNLLRLQKAYRKEHRARRRLEARLAARTAELEAARTDVLLRLARAAEFRDDLTGAHAERVGVLAGLIAREMGQQRGFSEMVEQAAPLHDVGKLAIPDTILHKPTELTAAERKVMESHTTIGSRLLAGSRDPMIQAAEEIALCHHEAWDGSGYPQGLERRDIPLSARIVTVADVFDSLCHDRPFREANTPEWSLEMVREGRGTRFDPDVVDAFVALVGHGKLKALDRVEVVPSDVRTTFSPQFAAEATEATEAQND